MTDLVQFVLDDITQPENGRLAKNGLLEIALELESTKGGPGSGNWGHTGRPGKRGGSGTGSGGLVNNPKALGRYRKGGGQNTKKYVDRIRKSTSLDKRNPKRAGNNNLSREELKELDIHDFSNYLREKANDISKDTKLSSLEKMRQLRALENDNNFYISQTGAVLGLKDVSKAKIAVYRDAPEKDLDEIDEFLKTPLEKFEYRERTVGAVARGAGENTRSSKRARKELDKIRIQQEKDRLGIKGGPGSGNWGHTGRPGKRGGSSTGSGGLGANPESLGAYRKRVGSEKTKEKAKELRKQHGRKRVIDEDRFVESQKEALDIAALTSPNAHMSTRAQQDQARMGRENVQRRYEQAVEARKVFKELVEKGEVREPTHLERHLSSAHGDPLLERTQASRRVLKKRGLDWRTGAKLGSGGFDGEVSFSDQKQAGNAGFEGNITINREAYAKMGKQDRLSLIAHEIAHQTIDKWMNKQALQGNFEQWDKSVEALTTQINERTPAGRIFVGSQFSIDEAWADSLGNYLAGTKYPIREHNNKAKSWARSVLKDSPYDASLLRKTINVVKRDLDSLVWIGS